MKLPGYLSQAIEEMARPKIHVIRDESIPRDRVVSVTVEAGGPAIVANSWMIIEMKHRYRGGRRLDPDAWFADILAKIEADAEKAMMMSLYDMQWEFAMNTARRVGKGWAIW